MPAIDHDVATAVELLGGILPVAVLLLDGTGRPTAANARACGLLGCTDGEELKRRWGGMRVGLDPARFPRHGKPVRLTIGLHELCPGAAERSLRLELHSLGGGPAPALLVLLKERQILDALDNRLLAAVRMRNQAFLAAVVGHELKRPLNAMSITLDLLDGSLSDPAPAAGDDKPGRERRYAAILREELGRLDELLTRAAGHGPPPLTAAPPVDLRELLREVAEPLDHQARRQAVALRLTVPDSALAVRADAEALRQVVLGIAINALGDLGDGGTLGIELAARGTIADLCVADGGSAMADEILDQAYALCFTPAMGDAALALYIARVVVESCGGELLIDRQPDNGKRVHLLLPLSR